MHGIVWPDIEAAFITYMQAALDARAEDFAADVTVGNLMPDPRPDRAVIVRDDGGPSLGDVRAVARLGVNVWASTATDCADLAALVTALINDWPDGSPVVKASASRSYPVADSSTQPHRYLTAEVWVRGTNL
jgi:hypothetical protein